MDTQNLKNSFQKERRDLDFDTPLRKANFCHEINNTFYAEFDDAYIIRLKNILGGGVRMYLNSKLKNYPHSSYHNGKVYFNEYEVDYILVEIEYYVKYDRWREGINEKEKNENEEV